MTDDELLERVLTRVRATVTPPGIYVLPDTVASHEAAEDVRRTIEALPEDVRGDLAAKRWRVFVVDRATTAGVTFNTPDGQAVTVLLMPHGVEPTNVHHEAAHVVRAHRPRSAEARAECEVEAIALAEKWGDGA